MNEFEQKYKQLNSAQKEAVNTIEGPVVVVAGPGTGKTQILTLRIANILKNAGAGIEPENILALTFTNAGVHAMKKRLAEFIGSDLAYRVGIFTFHSFAEEQIKNFPEYFPYLAYSSVATDVECLQIIEEILKENEFTYLKTFASESHYVRDIRGAIDELKREGISPELFLKKIEDQKKNIIADENSYYKRVTKKFKKGELKPQALKPVEKNLELQTVYSEYQEKLKEKKLYDYSDMILSLVEVMENNDEFLSILQEQYQYILVDEHQDTNESQNRIISALIDSPHLNSQPNIFTVGDDKQAIYRFQGASVENFTHFKKKFSEVKVIGLVDNYRSTQDILDISHSLIEKSENGNDHKKLSAFFDFENTKNKVQNFKTYKDELIFVVQDILQKIENGVNPSDIAVIYRENNNLPFIQEMFEKMHIPFVVTSKSNVLDDREIKKFLLLIRSIYNPRSSEVLVKVLFFDFLKLNVSDVILLLDLFNHVSKKTSLIDLISNEEFLKKNDVNDPKSFVNFSKFLIDQKSKSENCGFDEFFEELIRESDFIKHIFSKKDHVFLLAKLEKIFEDIKTQVRNNADYSLKDFINYLDLCAEYNLVLEASVPFDVEGVNLMTAHGSKGLEFDDVYITNVVHGLWGGKRKRQSFQLPVGSTHGDIEDERRLFYVALTRAKKNVTVTYSDFDLTGREKSPSLFISEMDENLISENKQEIDMENSIEISFAPRLIVAKSLIDLDYICEKFLNTQLSVSALNNYFQSPILYFFRNLVRLPSSQTKSLVYGNIIHGTLDKFFSQSSREKQVLSKEKLLEFFHQTVKLTYVAKDFYDSILTQGEKTLSDYYDNYAQDFNLNLETEKSIKKIPFKLETGEEIFLQGVIDKIEFDENGGVQVTDYKTGKSWSEKSKDDKEGLKRQVVFYKLLLDSYQEGKYKMNKGVLDFVERSKKSGEYEREFFDVNQNDLSALKDEINVFAKDILSGEFLKREVEAKFGNKAIGDYLELLRILERK